jgi:hypothetical protein
MKKPTNRIAIGLWVLAVLVLGTEVWVFANTYRWGPPGAVNFLGSFWQLIRSGVVSAAALAAYGAIIELLDKIRWNALSPKMQAAEMGRPSVWHIAQRDQHSTPD